MVEIRTNRLWLGNALDVREPVSLFEHGINVVVDLALDERPAQLPRQLIYCRYPLVDSGGNDPVVLRQSITAVRDFLEGGKTILVGCSAGMSRSPTVAAFAIAAVEGTDPEEVLLEISQSRGLEINGQLWKDAKRQFLNL